MTNNKFISKKQVKELSDKNWKVLPKGAYLTLYEDDFNDRDIWEQICTQVNAPTNSQKIEILYFGYQINS